VRTGVSGACSGLPLTGEGLAIAWVRVSSDNAVTSRRAKPAPGGMGGLGRSFKGWAGEQLGDGEADKGDARLVI